MTDDEVPAARDRLRELLDAVLDEENRTVDDMAGDASSVRPVSPWTPGTRSTG